MAKMTIAQRLLPFPDKNVPYLDAIRGVAVLFILIRHSWGLAGSPGIELGSIDLSPFVVMMSSGVDLFFVLSGMLLSAHFLRNDAQQLPPPRTFEYMTARVLRIGPPYWLVLFLVVLLYTPHYIENSRVWSEWGAATFVAHVAFLQTVFIWSFGTYSVASPFWTLTIEMLFYLLLPFVIRLFYNKRWWQGVVISFAMTAIWLYLARNGMPSLIDFIKGHQFGLPFDDTVIRFNLSHQIFGYLPHFAIGCSVSVILRHYKERLMGTHFGLALLMMGMAVVAIAMYILGSISLEHGYADPRRYMAQSSDAALIYYYFESIPFAVGYGMILLGVGLSSVRVKSSVSRVPLLCIAGVLGYSIYLIHMPLLYTLKDHAWIADDLSAMTRFWKLLIGGGGVIFACSLGLFFAIERPSMLWSSRASQSRKAVKEEAA